MQSLLSKPIQKDRIVLITPARNEAAHMRSVIRSIVRQTHRPALWIIVNDGSTDATGTIARKAAKKHDWIRVVDRDDRGRRVLGAGVIEAFDRGRNHIDIPYDFLAKVDADVTVGPRYLERCLQLFEADPKLGALSGKVYLEDEGDQVEEFMIDEMVAGQWKLYRKECFEEIGGFVHEVMWDGIDFHSARQKGWTTRSVEDPDLRIVHHRLMGSSDRNVLIGRLRWGRGQWFMGTHPLYMIASAAFRMLERPRGIGGLAILTGYVLAWLRRVERYSAPGFREELRRWQIQRLRKLATQGTAR